MKECYMHKCHLHDPSTPYCTQDTCIDECPHCLKKDYIPANILNNVVNLGSVVIKYRCVHCNQIITSEIKRKVIAKVVSSSK